MTAGPAHWQPEPGRYPPGYGPAAGQRTSRRSRRTTALLISGAVVLVLVVAGVAGALIHQAQLLPPGGPALVVPAPATAGPLTRDYAAEAGADKAAIQRARDLFGKDPALLSDAEFAAYRQPGHVDPVTHTPAVIFYIGMQFKPDTTGSLSDFMRGFASSLGAAGHLRPVSPGPAGGLAECAGTAFETICAWDAGHSAGILAAPARDFTPAQLAVLVRAARPAFDTTRAARS
jgi:hypothetical protein